jgi:hypothetical protein
MQHQSSDMHVLQQGTAYTVQLKRSSINQAEKASYFMALKTVQVNLRRIPDSETVASRDNRNLLRGFTDQGVRDDFREKAASAFPRTAIGLIDEADEPLQQQVLNQKRLATYFGVVQLGQCVDGSHTKTEACKGAQKEALTFKMLFDTGSCEFWVPGVGCTKDAKYASMCRNHRTYDTRKSDSYRLRFGNSGPFEIDQKMCIQYLSGKIEGFMAKDYVCVGALCVSEQVFGMADIIDVPLLKEVVWDGIIGLAFPNTKLSNQGVVPLMDNMMQSSILSNAIFAYYIGMSEGAVTFGGIDKKYIASQDDDKFRYAIVTEKTYWTIEIEDIFLQYGDDEPVNSNLCSSSVSGERCKAIVDTGTYLVYGPQEQMSGNAPLSVLKVDDCDDLNKRGASQGGELPTVIFKLYAGENAESAKLALHPHDYVLEFTLPVDSHVAFVEEGLDAATRHLESNRAVDCVNPKNRKDPRKCKQDCVIGIAPDNDPGWTFGQVFLRSFYTVFDRTEGQEKVGFLRNNPRIPTGAPTPLVGSIEGELRDMENNLIAHNGKMESPPSP